jgi:DNA-binding IclR family transcriptional regulator
LLKEITQQSDRYIVPAVEQASRILFCMAGHGSSHMSLTDICGKVGIHKSKAYSILLTFQRFGIIQKNVDGKGYSLGPSLMSLSRKVLDNFNIQKSAEPALEELAKKTGGTMTLGLIAEDKVFVAAKYESSADIGVTVRVGHSYPLSYGSHGKAIAAFLPKEKLDNLLKNKQLYFYNKLGSVDNSRLEKELAQCRQDGFALDLGEVTPGLNTVAAPVLGPKSNPIGYITLLGLFNAETALQYGPLIAEAARKISQQVGLGIN